MFVFRKILRALFSWNTRFKIRPFALLPTNNTNSKNNSIDEGNTNIMNFGEKLKTLCQIYKETV